MSIPIIMFSLQISSKKLLSAVELFHSLIQPNNTITMNFLPERAMLLATSADGLVQAFLVLNDNFSLYTCNSPCSYALNNDEFYHYLYSAEDTYPNGHIKIRGTDLPNFFMRDTSDMPVEIQVHHMLNVFDPLPMDYTAKVGIRKKLFISMLDFFTNFESNEYVYVKVTPKVVKFSADHHKFKLSKPREECEIEGVGIDLEYEDKFIWQNLRMEAFRRTIGMITGSVWFYPSFPDGDPPVFMCPVDSVGNIMFKFLSPNDAW